MEAENFFLKMDRTIKALSATETHRDKDATYLITAASMKAKSITTMPAEKGSTPIRFRTTSTLENGWRTYLMA